MKYILPKVKKKVRKNPAGVNVPYIEDDLEWMRRVNIPANKELIDSLEVGKSGTVILKGRIVGLEMNEREDEGEGMKKERGDIRISLDSVETVGDNEYEQMAREDE